MDEEARLYPRCDVPMTDGALRTPNADVGGRGHTWGWNLCARWEGEGGPYRVSAFRWPSCGAVELAATERPNRPGCAGALLLIAGVCAAYVGSSNGCWRVDRRRQCPVLSA